MSDDNLDPNTATVSITGDVLQLAVLDESGVPFSDSDPDTWQAADAATPEYLHLGSIRLTIVAEASDLAMAVGAIEPGEAVVCLRAAFEKGESVQTPAAGQYVVLKAGDVPLSFIVAATHQDLHGTDGPDAMYDEAFDELKPGEALLVQVLGAVGDQPSEASL